MTSVVVKCPLPHVLPPCPVQGCCGQPGVPSLAWTTLLSHQPGPLPLLWVVAGVGSFPLCLWQNTLVEKGAGLCHLRHGVPWLCPPTLCPLFLPQLRAHAVERRTHIVSHQHGMTVMKMLQEGEVRLRGVSPLCPPDEAHRQRGVHGWSVPPRGAPRLQGMVPPGTMGLWLSHKVAVYLCRESPSAKASPTAVTRCGGCYWKVPASCCCGCWRAGRQCPPASPSQPSTPRATSAPPAT